MVPGCKFGMFIHWGIYSMLADGEWVLTNKSLNEAEYQKLADGFYPSKFNADEWVRIAKDAGMKYICFTSRHHDGFSMFDTKQSDYNIVKATPFKRDVIKELAEAARNTGLNYSSTIPILTGTVRIIIRGDARDGIRVVPLPARGKIT